MHFFREALHFKYFICRIFFSSRRELLSSRRGLSSSRRGLLSSRRELKNL